MRIRPIPRLVRVRVGDLVLAESRDAVRVTEVARDVYDSVVYFPRVDVADSLERVPEKSTHCPLKGDAVYYRMGAGNELAWSYEAPFDFAAELKDRVAFYADSVVLEELGGRGE